MRTKLQRAGEWTTIAGLLVFVLGETVPVVATMEGENSCRTYWDFASFEQYVEVVINAQWALGETDP
jgi:hypothetical protein